MEQVIICYKFMRYCWKCLYKYLGCVQMDCSDIGEGLSWNPRAADEVL
jgi:hypothetical protein